MRCSRRRSPGSRPSSAEERRPRCVTIGLFVWVVLIVILGVVSSIVSRRAKRQRRPPSSRRGRPPRTLVAARLGCRRSGDPDARDAGDRRATGRPAAPARPVRPAAEPAPAPPPPRRPPQPARHAAAASGRAPAPPLRRVRRDLVRAVIAAEVLGKPQAFNDEYPRELDRQRSIDLHELSDRVRLFGEYDRNCRRSSRPSTSRCAPTATSLLLAGDDAAVARAERVVRRVLDAAVGGAHITPDDVALALSDSALNSRTRHAARSTLLRTQRGREVRPRTAGQRAFVDVDRSDTR